MRIELSSKTSAKFLDHHQEWKDYFNSIWRNGVWCRVQSGTNDEDTPAGSVGTTVAGVDVKLSEGKEGEMLVKSPFMFSK